MIRAIIFDCFGVLVGQGFDATYSLAGGDPAADRAFISDSLGQANLGLISPVEFHQAMQDQLGVSEAVWHQARRDTEHLNQPLLAYITKLRETYKTAVLSNVNRDGVRRVIPSDILDSSFDVVVESAVFGVAKPDSRAYTLTADKLSLQPSECIFTDDSGYFCEAARDAGMQAVHYQNFAQFKASLEQLLSDAKD